MDSSTPREAPARPSVRPAGGVSVDTLALVIAAVIAIGIASGLVPGVPW